jgi:uncharacterized protein YacL (UPF0231 family)
MTNNCGQCEDLTLDFIRTSGGKFQVRVATSGLIVKFSLMNNVFSNLTTLLQVVTTLTKLIFSYALYIIMIIILYCK